MPVPISIDDLSEAAADNYPKGSEQVFPNLDNYLRAHASFIAQLRETIRSEIDDLTEAQEAARNAAWPVGSVYINASSSDNPGSFLPGTWVQITQGFLYPVGAPGAGYAGTTGGEEKHTLTVAEMPQHTHAGTAVYAGEHTHNYTETYTDSGTGLWGELGQVKQRVSTTAASGGHSHMLSLNEAGSGAGHNNLPPFLTVYMWKRTA